MSLQTLDAASQNDRRTRDVWEERTGDLRRSTDRMFAILMLLQWAGGVLTALVVSPRTWIGLESTTHLHVWAAVILGGLLTSFPVFLARTQPGRPITRHVIAVSQMLWSALLIHLSGGRIETHFHVFGSLAFLAFYRDWRVLVTATIVVAADHFVRGVWWPQSVFGIYVSSPYRWLEHAGWVAFEDLFLVLSCLRGNREMMQIARRQVELEHEVAQRHQVESDLAVANVELARHNVEMQQFIYTVSHDLKSPIVTCVGYLGILREDLAAGRLDDVSDAMKRLDRSMDRMNRSINDLLQLSRIGRVQDNPQPLSMGALIGELAGELAPRLQDHSVTLTVEDGLPDIVGDRGRVVEVFENLLTNALKYGCPEPGMSIALGGARFDGEARFFVRDQGPGIAPEYHKKVFGLFQRLDQKQEGSGVGLAIVERIMQVQGGRAWVESEPGAGACFWVAFPTPAGAAVREHPARLPAMAAA